MSTLNGSPVSWAEAHSALERAEAPSGITRLEVAWSQATGMFHWRATVAGAEWSGVEETFGGALDTVANLYGDYMKELE